MMLAVALLCIIGQRCDQSSAIDRLVLGRAGSLLQCEMYSQMTLASLAIQPGPGQQWVIQCIPPTSIGKTVG